MDSDAPATAPSVAGATEPSEVAAVLAEVADALPEHAARTLLRLLQNDLAERSTPLVRIEGLGLLAQMVDATGEVPTGEEYEALRARRAEVGEQWPDRTTLARTSGGWIRAVRAAMRLWLEGGVRGYPPAANRRQATLHWSREQVVDALIGYYRRWGEWPYAHEFYAWGVLERRLALYKGRPGRRVPSSHPVERLWPEDGFDGSLGEARRRVRSGGRGAR